MYALKVTSAPAAEPITLAETLNYLGLASSASTTLSADAAASATTIQVTSAAGFAVGDTVTVGDETARITAIAGTALTITPALPFAVPSGSSVAAGNDYELVAALITAARQQVEAHLGRALITQSQRLTIDGFYDPTIPARPPTIRLPRPPLQSVESVKYDDVDNTEQTVDTAVYDVDTDGEPGSVYLKPNQWWPTSTSVYHPQVRIAYTCGYGANRGDVPDAIRFGLKQAVAVLWQNDQPGIQSERVGNISVTYAQATDAPAIHAVLAPYRVWAW